MQFNDDLDRIRELERAVSHLRIQMWLAVIAMTAITVLAMTK